MMSVDYHFGICYRSPSPSYCTSGWLSTYIVLSVCCSLAMGSLISSWCYKPDIDYWHSKLYRKIRLIDADPVAFPVYSQWLETQNIDIGLQSATNSCSLYLRLLVLAHMDCYMLGQRLGSPQFSNDIIDSLLRRTCAAAYFTSQPRPDRKARTAVMPSTACRVTIDAVARSKLSCPRHISAQAHQVCEEARAPRRDCIKALQTGLDE